MAEFVISSLNMVSSSPSIALISVRDLAEKKCSLVLGRLLLSRNVRLALLRKGKHENISRGVQLVIMYLGHHHFWSL